MSFHDSGDCLLGLFVQGMSQGAIYVFLFLIGGGELLGWEYLVGPMRRRFVSVCGRAEH